MENNSLTNLTEMIVDTQVGLTKKEFDGVVRAKGQQLFGEFFYHYSDYDGKTQSGRYVIAKNPIPHIVEALNSEENFYLQRGRTFYLIDERNILTVSQEFPEGFVNLEEWTPAKKSSKKMVFSVSVGSLLPYVIGFVIAISVVAGASFGLNTKLADVETQLAAVQKKAPKVEKGKKLLPDYSVQIKAVAEEVGSAGYISRVEMDNNRRLVFDVVTYIEDDAFRLADKVGGEVKNGQVRFTR